MTPDPQDPRLGLPSASGFAKVANCGGSRAAEQGLPELPKQAVTESGTEIHSARESGNHEDLEPGDKEVADKLALMEREALEAWAAEIGCAPDQAQVFRERRLWLCNTAGGVSTPLTSAQLDVAYIIEPFALVLDLKTGYKQTTPSERNWQVRVQVACLSYNHPKLIRIRAGIAASRLSSKLDVTDHTPEDIRRIEYEIRHVLWRSEQPDAPRVPGEWCRYCRASGECREHAVYHQISTSYAVMRKNGLDPLGTIERIGKMTPEELGFVYQRKSIVGTIYDAIKARLLSLDDAALERAGFRRKPPGKRKEITNAAEAFKRLGGLLSDAERVQCLKLLRTDAAALLAERTGESKKACQEQVDAALGDVLIEKQNETERLVEL